MGQQEETNLAEVVLALEKLQAETQDISEDGLYVLDKDSNKVLL